MLILIMRNMANNNMYIIQNFFAFLHLFKVTLVISLESKFFSSILSLHSSTNLSINLFYTCRFYNRNILQHHMIYRVHIHICWTPVKSFITHSLVNQFFAFTSAFICIPSLFIIKNTSI